MTTADRLAANLGVTPGWARQLIRRYHMATNEQEAPPPPTKEERVLAAVGMTAARIADTGAHTGITFRVWIMFIVLAAVVAAGAFPLNVVGTVVLTALAITLASRTRVQR